MNAGPVVSRGVAWLGHQLRRRVPYSESNFFLEGAFKPVAAECSETTLRVTGRIPAELNGLLARIGPNPLRVENPAAYHWFIGDGMVHGLRLREGRALWYRSRWVGSDSVNRSLGRPLLPGPRRGVSDVVNTNIIGHAGRLWALTEAGVLPAEIDGELTTLGHSYFNSESSLPCSAHPRLDPQTGELHAVCYDATARSSVQYVVIGPDGALKKQLSIPVKHGPMIHDCAITRSKVVILDLPVTFSLREFLRGAGLPYRWNPRHQARVGLLPRDGAVADIRWLPVEPCYVFHTCNAHDLADGSVVMNVVAHERMFDQTRATGPEVGKVRFERWTLDAVRDRVVRTVLCDRRQEFPRFDERRTGQPSRYAYAVGFPADSATPQSLIRHDLGKGSDQVRDYGLRYVPGEAIFVPRNDSSAEDEGWLLACVYDSQTDRSEVVILDAADFSGEPQAVVHLPVRVPAGFHGNWIADRPSAAAAPSR